MKRGIEAPTWWHNPSMDKLDRRTRRTREALYGPLTIDRTPDESHVRIHDHFRELFPDAPESRLTKLIG